MTLKQINKPIENYVAIIIKFYDLCTNFTGYLNENHAKFKERSSYRYSPINLIIFNIYFILTDQDSAEDQRAHILICKS
jgi:hypothetical protein